jgi:hypothetical protein
MGMMLRAWTLLALTVAALSLGPSFAHVLEAPPRLSVWPPELWREATVFNGQFQLFAMIGGPLDIGAIITTAVLAYLLRHDRSGFRFALAGSVLFALALFVPPTASLRPGRLVRFRRISMRSATAGKRGTW